MFDCMHENMLHEIQKFKVTIMIFILCKYTPKVLILSKYILNIFKIY